MWKFPQFIHFLNDIVKHPLVGEIIVVDNNPNERPHPDFFANEKINLVTFGKNIFVNPAWNYGVFKAKYDKIGIMNDDIIFDLRIFDRVYPFIIEEIGPSGLSVRPWHEHFVDGLIRIEPFAPGANTFLFANMFFIHRKSWQVIPAGLDLYFGDNYVFDTALWNNKPIYLIKDIFYASPYGATCGFLGQDTRIEMFNRERQLYREIILSRGIDPAVWCPEHFATPT